MTHQQNQNKQIFSVYTYINVYYTINTFQASHLCIENGYNPALTNQYCCEKDYDRQDEKNNTMLPSIHDFVKLTGFSARDIKITELPHGNRKATLILGSYMKSNLKEDETRRDLVWHRITAWGGLARDLAMYIRRGTWLSISARIHQKSSIGQDGTTKNWEELVLVDFRKICTAPASEKNHEFRPGRKSDYGVRLQESPGISVL